MKDDQQKTLLERGVEEIIDKEHLEKRLKNGDKLRVKLGIDPTSPNIHLGRSIPLLKLKDFQDAGHQVVLIIGDFTGVIGDTSDKESERPMLENETIKKNLENYIEQAGKILDLSKVEVRYNSEWLNPLNYGDIGRHADVFSLSDFISRENIKKRLDAGKRVSLRELLYPLMQGYDSVAIKADVELGGTDQKFNLLAGRDLQREYGQEPQDIMTGPLIEGLDGRKMSSSWGNTVNLMDSPNEMFGKIMSLKDEFIIKYFILLTRVPMGQIEEHKITLEKGENPKNIKMKLGFELVRMYHSEADAKKAEEYWVSTFSKKEIPDDLETLSPSSYLLLDVLIESKAVTSKGEARRVIEENGVKINGEVATDGNQTLKSGDILQKGKMFFLKIN